VQKIKQKDLEKNESSLSILSKNTIPTKGPPRWKENNFSTIPDKERSKSEKSGQKIQTRSITSIEKLVVASMKNRR